VGVGKIAQVGHSSHGNWRATATRRPDLWVAPLTFVAFSAVQWRLLRLGGVGLTITETVLVFVGIPAVVIGSVFALVYGGSAARGKRYRPGRQFDSSPVWFLAEAIPGAPKHEVPALAGAEFVRHGEVGGASDSW
jgi:hypothetical protein